MHALKELAGVVTAGVLAFFGGIALLAGILLLWGCGLASGLCLIVAIFSGVMYGITGKVHDGRLALTYLAYAAIPFVLTFMAGYYRSKLGGAPNQDLARRNTLAS